MNIKNQQADASKYYTVMHPEQFKINWKAFYDKVDALTAATRRAFPHRLNIPYGDHWKQRLDLYFPKGKPGGCPVFLFLHGGGFREGDRAHYGYLANTFGEHGIVTAVASYRLAPDFVYPAQPEDVQMVLAWLYRNVHAYGGDPDQIYIGGHSAGAILSAFVSLKTDWLKRYSLPVQLIKGLAAVSSPYDLRKVGWTEVYLPDSKVREEASPILNIDHVPPAAVVAVGTKEEEEGWANPSIAFAGKLKQKGCQAETVLLDGLDHPGTALALGDGQGPLFLRVLKMIRPEKRD